MRSAAPPITLVTGVEVNAAILLVSPQALVDGQVGTGFRVARAFFALVAQFLDVVGEGAIALGRIAIGGEGEAGVGAGKCLGVQRAQTVAFDHLAKGATGGMGHVQ
ncbi:hypothetical protein D3C81_1402550 [compost metagenome]